VVVNSVAGKAVSEQRMVGDLDQVQGEFELRF
jgi:hypothetical protein